MLTLQRCITARSLGFVSFTDRCDRAGDDPVIDDPADDSHATWLNQVHGCEVVRVKSPGDQAGVSADAAWTTSPGAALAIRTADCLPIALYGATASGVSAATTAAPTPTPAIAAIHAGWKGLLAGVIQATAAQMRAAGIAGLRAIVGPYIHAASYEFGQSDLDKMLERYGPHVGALTSQGKPALDLGAAALAALNESDIALDYLSHSCTAAASDRYFSHRARGETERMTMTVVVSPATQARPASST